jgi:N-terminal acetyltransferase B complex non-catalytic subunit
VVSSQVCSTKLQGCSKGRFVGIDFHNANTSVQAALNYSRKFKGKRRPFYWSILALHLASNTSEIPETEKKVYSEMAYRLLITAVETTKSEVQNPAPGSGSNEESVGKTSQDSARGFRGPNDLQLLVYIYKSQGRHKDALAVLNHPEIGIRSTICNSSWELVREKLKLQEQCELWESLWRTCHDLLLEANPSCRGIPREDTEELQVGVFGNDWLVWESMIRAASKYSNPE